MRDLSVFSALGLIPGFFFFTLGMWSGEGHMLGLAEFWVEAWRFLFSLLVGFLGYLGVLTPLGWGCRVAGVGAVG